MFTPYPPPNDAEGRFHLQLRSLHEISMDLATQPDLHRFCRLAVSWGLSNLGFDRMSLWLIDPDDPAWNLGTWGTDEQGRLQDERGARVPRSSLIAPPEFYEGKVPVLAFHNELCYDKYRNAVGVADKALAPLWDGKAIIGELSADNLVSKRPIGPRDLDILVLYARILAHLHTLLKTKEALAQMGEARGTLLKEMKHRTRNNLSMVQGLICLEASQAVEQETRDRLEVLRSRIDVLGSLYDLLDRELDGSPVRLDLYLGTVARRLSEAYGAQARGIFVDLDLAPVSYDERWAASLGIVVNELMTDSFKYAFAGGRTGRIGVRLATDGPEAVLEIRDDGPGLPADFDLEKVQGLGLKLALALVQQVSGSLRCRSEAGAVFTLRFPRKTTRG